MGKSRSKATRRSAHAGPVAQVTAPTQMFASGGAWATKMIKAAAFEGRALTAEVLRTLDTLREREWEAFDNAVITEGTIRLVGVADLISAGHVVNVPNALGRTIFSYEKMTDMDAAETTMSGLARTANDTVEFDLSSTPLPFTHKDYFLDIRRLAASRTFGEPLDTTQAGLAGRVVAEQLENMLFNGGPQFGSHVIYGYRTEPNRNQGAFTDSDDWGDSTKTPESFLADVQKMIRRAEADRFFGPYTIYVPTDADTVLDGDYFRAGGTSVSTTIRERLLKMNRISAIRVADQLPTGNVILKQNSPDVASWINGEGVSNVQWDEAGGMRINFKALAIGVPLIRSTLSGRSGVVHLADGQVDPS